MNIFCPSAALAAACCAGHEPEKPLLRRRRIPAAGEQKMDCGRTA